MVVDFTGDRDDKTRIKRGNSVAIRTDDPVAATRKRPLERATRESRYETR